MTEDKRISDLWFSTDGLVLRAEKSIFRVTKSILAARSSVLRDMIALPQPPGHEQEIIDGCPVVSLHDSAADVEVFLRAVFDSSYFMPPPEPVDLPALLGILRLAHKYDVRYLYIRALKHLAVSDCPTEMHEYLAIEPDHVIHPSEAHTFWLAKIIATAKVVGALWLLPMAYHRAASCSPDELRSALSLGAEADIIQTCLAARSEHMKGIIALNRCFALPPGDGCTGGSDCVKVRLRKLDRVLENIEEGEFGLSALDFWYDEYMWKLTFGDEYMWKLTFGNLGYPGYVCPDCVLKTKEHHEAAFEKFWDKLPSIYGLPPWPELTALKDTAMNETA
ncbi:hypothetical protein C8R47DRAFT_133666 [Mycena vitilis]|nr:hypothetical protein C8R47DRAFT_133666 [Mycena vitilis]